MSDTKTERPTPERLSDYITACSDGHCILRDPSTPRGQHTNGGCRHLKERGPEATKQLMAMGAEIVGLRAQVAVRSADLEKERAIATDALRRATEAELGCDVLATGDPYERLASTLEAARMVENERDSLRKRCHEAEREAGRQRSIADALRTDLRCMTTRAADLGVVVHALYTRLGVEEIELSQAETLAACEKEVTRELIVEERNDWLGPVRIVSWLRFSSAFARRAAVAWYDGLQQALAVKRLEAEADHARQLAPVDPCDHDDYRAVGRAEALTDAVRIVRRAEANTPNDRSE